MSTRKKTTIRNNKTRKLSSPTHTFFSLQYPSYERERQEKKEEQEEKNERRRIINEMREEKKKSEKRKIKKIKNDISQAELRKQEVFGSKDKSIVEDEDEDEDEELAGIDDTWRDTEGEFQFKTIRRSPTVRESLNKSIGGKRKRNSTKKKRRNKKKKRTTKK